MALDIVDGMPAILHNGELRVLAALPPEPEVYDSFRVYGQNYPLLSPDEWKECDYRWAKVPTRDQRQTSSCTGHAGVTAFEYHRATSGMPYVELSRTFSYAHVNGGRDQGASVSSIMATLQKDGACPDALFPVSKLFLQQATPEAVKAALDFRLDEAFVCQAFAGLCSALTLFGPISLGIVVGRNFANLDRNGVAPLPDVIAGGHALCGCGLKVIGGQWHILLHNSWGANFGMDGGFCYINERHTRQMLDGFALIAPRESDRTDDGDEPPRAI